MIDSIIIIICIGFILCLIPVILMLFCEYDSYYANLFLTGYYYEGEKILKVWHLLLICIVALIPVLNIAVGLLLILNFASNLDLGIYKWNINTVLYKILTKRI